MSIFSNKQVTGGQVRAYGDSVYRWTVTAPADADDKAVWDYCQTLMAVNHRNNDHRQHSGSCGFPFGMGSFGGLWKESPNWRYSVVQPYTD